MPPINTEDSLPILLAGANITVYPTRAYLLEQLRNILLAKENVTITLETYRLGSTTFIQLREAEKSLEDAYDRLIAARYNAKVAETELLRLKGDLVK